MSAHVQIRGLTRRFTEADRSALAGLDLDVARGEVVCLVGPSGCGKSTTLRLIAGLDRPDGGSIHIAGRDMQGVAPQQRDVAMVFQGFALYPHMTVREILAFPLRMRGSARAEIERAVAAAAEMLAISPLLERRPGELSGGEQQRVAMGRAIVRKPQVFLFDEPLSNLDAALRSDLRIELGKLLRELDATALYVTHDQIEAMTLGQRIAVLKAGQLEQLATPRQIYEAPASAFVAGFFGSPPMNLLQVTGRAGRASLGTLELETPSGHDGELWLGIRPEHIRLTRQHGAPGVKGTVTAVEPLGAESHVALALAGQELRTRVPGFDAPAPGSTIDLSLELAQIRWFSRDTGLAL